MSNRKIGTNPLIAANFLSKYYQRSIQEIIEIKAGERSETYSYTFDEKKYILRFNREIEGFKKDHNAYVNFGSLFPVPNILKIGSFGKNYFSISDMAEGHDLSDNENLSPALLKDIFRIMTIIHSYKVDPANNYGLINEYRKGDSNSWEEFVFKPYLLYVKENGKYLTWDEVYMLPNIEMSDFEKIDEGIKKLLRFLPLRKYFIHGDFGGNNLIADKGKITGVLDWSESMYGDFLYDIAYYSFWSGDNLIVKYRDFLKNKNVDFTFFNERIVCHQLFICKNALGIGAYSQNKKEYFEVKEKLKELLNQAC